MSTGQPPIPPGPPGPLVPAYPPAPEPKPKLPLVVGAFAGAVAPWFFSLVPLILTNGNTAAGYGLLSWLVVPLVGVALLIAPATRRWGAGVLLGFFGMLVVGAGACIVVIVGLNAAGGPG